METSLAESQTDSYFPQSGQNGYPKQKDVSDTHIQRRTITKINHDRRTALERSVKSISLGWGVGLKSILRGHNPRPYFCRGLEFLCVSVLRVASGPRVKLASCKSALNPPLVCSTDRSKAVVSVLVLLFVALWFILRGDLLYVFPCVILFLCFSFLLILRLPRLRKRELTLVLFVRLFGLCLFGFVGFLFLLGSGKGCGL